MIVTLNGKTAAVVQYAEPDQRLLDLAAEADASEGIRQGREDRRVGRVRPAGAAFADLRKEVGLTPCSR